MAKKPVTVTSPVQERAQSINYVDPPKLGPTAKVRVHSRGFMSFLSQDITPGENILTVRTEELDKLKADYLETDAELHDASVRSMLDRKVKQFETKYPNMRHPFSYEGCFREIVGRDIKPFSSLEVVE